MLLEACWFLAIKTTLTYTVSNDINKDLRDMLQICLVPSLTGEVNKSTVYIPLYLCSNWVDIVKSSTRSYHVSEGCIRWATDGQHVESDTRAGQE